MRMQRLPQTLLKRLFWKRKVAPEEETSRAEGPCGISAADIKRRIGLLILKEIRKIFLQQVQVLNTIPTVRHLLHYLIMLTGKKDTLLLRRVCRLVPQC